MDQTQQQCFTQVETIQSEQLKERQHITMQRDSSPHANLQNMSSPKYVGYSRNQPIQLITHHHKNINSQQRVDSNHNQNKPQSQVIPYMKVKEIHHIQINREEAEYWKNRYYQLETQIKNQPEKVTYVEDNQRTYQLEQQIHTYISEIERLTTVIRSTSTELTQWRQRATELQTYLNQQQTIESDFEKMKNGNPNLFSNIHLLVSYENEMYLQSEIQRLQQTLQQSQYQMQQMIESSKMYEQRTKDFEQMKHNYDAEIQELQSRENHLLNQLERLNRELIDSNNRLNKEINYRQEEISKMTQITQTLQLALQDTSKYQEYELKMQMQTEEIQNLQQRLMIKSEELEKTKKKLANSQNEYQEAIQYKDFEQKYHYLVQDVEQLRMSLKNKQEENESLRNCISKLQITLNDNSKYEDYENKIALLTSEIERLHQSLKSRNDELEQGHSQWQNESEQLKGEIQRLNMQSKNKIQEMERLKSQSDQNINVLSNEVEKLTYQLRCKNDEIEKWKNSISQLQQENQRMKSLESQMQSENYKQRNLENQNNQLSLEVERLNSVINTKSSEYQQLKQQFMRYEQSYKNNNSEMEMKMYQLQNDQKNMESKLMGCYFRIILVSSENERLTLILKQQLEQINNLKQQGSEQYYYEKQSLSEQISHLTKELDSWKQQFIVMNREYHKNQEQLILLQAELDSIKSKKTTSIQDLKEMKENVRFSGMVVEKSETVKSSQTNYQQQQFQFSSQPYVSFNQTGQQLSYRPNQEQLF